MMDSTVQHHSQPSSSVTATMNEVAHVLLNDTFP